MKKAKPVAPPVTVPAKKSSFWDDDEPVQEAPKPPPPAVTKPQPKAEPPKLLPVAPPCPEGSYSIQCGEDRVLILRPIRGFHSDWSELLCYHYRLETNIHIKREALQPKDTVDRTIQYLIQTLVK